MPCRAWSRQPNAGEDVILARDGKPVAKIVRYQSPKVKPPGAWKGKVKVSPDCDCTETNAEIAALFEESAGPEHQISCSGRRLSRSTT